MSAKLALWPLAKRKKKNKKKKKRVKVGIVSISQQAYSFFAFFLFSFFLPPTFFISLFCFIPLLRLITPISCTLSYTQAHSCSSLSQVHLEGEGNRFRGILSLLSTVLLNLSTIFLRGKWITRERLCCCYGKLLCSRVNFFYLFFQIQDCCCISL